MATTIDLGKAFKDYDRPDMTLEERARHYALRNGALAFAEVVAAQTKEGSRQKEILRVIREAKEKGDLAIAKDYSGADDKGGDEKVNK
jgi:DNA transposition AAA+ family ATPase